jgi:hypothetical protein
LIALDSPNKIKITKMKTIKSILMIAAFTLVVSHAQATTTDCKPVPRTFDAPDAGSVYALAALATGGVALARRFMR